MVDTKFRFQPFVLKRYIIHPVSYIATQQFYCNYELVIRLSSFKRLDKLSSHMEKEQKLLDINNNSFQILRRVENMEAYYTITVPLTDIIAQLDTSSESRKEGDRFSRQIHLSAEGMDKRSLEFIFGACTNVSDRDS